VLKKLNEKYKTQLSVFIISCIIVILLIFFLSLYAGLFYKFHELLLLFRVPLFYMTCGALLLFSGWPLIKIILAQLIEFITLDYDKDKNNKVLRLRWIFIRYFFLSTIYFFIFGLYLFIAGFKTGDKLVILAMFGLIFVRILHYTVGKKGISKKVGELIVYALIPFGIIWLFGWLVLIKPSFIEGHILVYIVISIALIFFILAVEVIILTLIKPLFDKYIEIINAKHIKRNKDDEIKKNAKKNGKPKSDQKNNVNKINIELMLVVVIIILGGLGFRSLTLEHKPDPLILPDNSGVHSIYDNGEFVGHIQIRGSLISDMGIIAAGIPIQIKTTISFFNNPEYYNRSLHFQFWYVGGDRNWILVVEDFNIKPGESIIIENMTTFPTQGVYRHRLRSYNGLDITPEYLYGSNTSVYGRDTAVLIENTYIQREANEKIIGLSYIVIAVSLANVASLLRKRKNERN